MVPRIRAFDMHIVSAPVGSRPALMRDVRHDSV
jgi:hypothetical protein